MKHSNTILISSNELFGIYRSRLKIIEKMKTHGLDIEVMARDDKKLPYDDIKERVGFTDINFKNKIDAIRIIMRKYAFCRKPDLILCFNLDCIITFFIINFFFRSNTMYVITGMGGYYTKSIIYRTALRHVLKLIVYMSTITIFQNETDIAAVFGRKKPPANVKLIPGSGVDLDLFNFSPKRYNSCDCWEKDKKLKILSAGRPVKEKGFRSFLKMAEADVLGNKYTWLGTVTKDMGLNIACENLEIRYSHDVAMELQNHDVLLFLSEYGEGVPRIVLEGMASGITVIAIKNVGLVDFCVDKKNIFYITDDLPRTFQMTLDMLMENPNLRSHVRRNARDTVEKEHDLRIIAEIYCSKIKEILDFYE